MTEYVFVCVHVYGCFGAMWGVYLPVKSLVMDIPYSHSLVHMGRNCNKNSELARWKQQVRIMKDISINNETVSTDTSSCNYPRGTEFGADIAWKHHLIRIAFFILLLCITILFWFNSKMSIQRSYSLIDSLNTQVCLKMCIFTNT